MFNVDDDNLSYRDSKREKEKENSIQNEMKQINRI